MIAKKQVDEIVIEDIKSESDDYYSDDDIYNITSWGADLSFRELITMYEEGELEKPELQRYYVWDKSEASRFIESLLLGLPVPSIFLARTRRENKLIIDGYQRIMTVYDYVGGIFSRDNKVFKLSNSRKINKRWRGKAFAELEETEQRRIRSTTIHAIIFEQIHPKVGNTSLYQVFERINTTGRMLTTQEIRNCVYQGLFNTALIKINTEKAWRDLYGIRAVDPRMRDMEFILRFLALSCSDVKSIKATQISMKKFLNDFMGNKESNDKQILSKREDLFIKTVNFINKYIGKEAFHNITVIKPSEHIRYTNRFHPTIFDAVSVATAYALQTNKKVKTDTLGQDRIRLLRDKMFIEYTTIRTTNIKHIIGRISLALKYLYGLDYEQQKGRANTK